MLTSGSWCGPGAANHHDELSVCAFYRKGGRHFITRLSFDLGQSRCRIGWMGSLARLCDGVSIVWAIPLSQHTTVVDVLLSFEAGPVGELGGSGVVLDASAAEEECLGMRIS